MGDYKQISHHLGFLEGNLLNCLEIANPIMEGIDDLDVLNVWDSVPGIAEIFHVVLEDFIMLLLDGLQSFYCRWVLACTLEVPNECGT
jgi:hypothetical protein